MERYQLWIDGDHVPPASGAYRAVRNPADIDDVLGEAGLATVADVQAAIAAASTAQPAWGARTGPERGRVLYRAAQLLEAQAGEWAAALTREEGKTRTEALGEVNRAVDVLRYFAGACWRVGGETLPADTPHTLLYTTRAPLGVAAIITPWNFPLAIPVWKIAPALAMGTTVVFKPASATPLLGLRLAYLFHEAGLPAGALNVVTGAGGEVGDALVRDERIDGVSFTGSYAVGQRLYQLTAPRLIRTHLEMGGKNPLIVAADADIPRAVSLAVRGGFGLTGQACTATSRVIVEQPLVPEFTRALAEAARALVVGPGLEPGVQMGPAVSASQRATDLQYVQIAQDEGARLVAGGATPDVPGLTNGHFVQPTVFADVRPGMRIAQEEVFGPVIAVLAADDLEHAFQISNDIGYGLSAAICTNDLRRALRFAERSQAGMIKINQPTPGVSVQAPFGGFKMSGTGMFKEMGSTGVDFYTRVKTVYLDAQ